MFISLMQRHELIVQVQELAASEPGSGIDPNKLSSLSHDDLIGTFAYLQRIKYENRGG